MANQIVVNANQTVSKINRNIYGHFAEHLGRCIYNGFYVGENSDIPNVDGLRLDIIEALREIRIPVLRWPGGCFADEYHWMDGIGPKELRPSMINTHWGGVVENNAFGTHEFMELCEKLGCEPYICGNVGSGTVREMSEWIEYMTFDGKSPMADLRRKNGKEEPWKLKYFGIGNENWNCGGRMRAEFYADNLNRYNLYARDYGENKLFRIAVGPRGKNYHWTEVLMREAALYIDGLSLHHYTRVGDKVIIHKCADDNEKYTSKQGEDHFRGSATDFDEKDWFGIMKAALMMDEIITKHAAIMDKYDPEKKVALIVDEWGTWFDCEPGTNPGFLYQQNTLRDAVSAAATLNIFNNHSDRVQMTNIAQTINVLQAMILTEGDRMVLTPTYHVYNMYKVHQDSELLNCGIVSDEYKYNGEKIQKINSTVSLDCKGIIHITLVNMDPNEPATVVCYVSEYGSFSLKHGEILTSENMNDMNTFDVPDRIKPEKFMGAVIKGDKVIIEMPPKAIVMLALEQVK